MILIREITEVDSKRYLELNKRLDQETSFMLFESGERTTTIEQQRTMISSIIKSENSNLIVAESSDRLVGHLMVE